MLNLKIDHCVIHVSDWECSNHFYAAVMGAEVVPRQKGFAYKFGDFLLNCHGPGVRRQSCRARSCRAGRERSCFVVAGTARRGHRAFGRTGCSDRTWPRRDARRQGRGDKCLFPRPGRLAARIHELCEVLRNSRTRANRPETFRQSARRIRVVARAMIAIEQLDIAGAEFCQPMRAAMRERPR